MWNINCEDINNYSFVVISMKCIYNELNPSGVINKYTLIFNNPFYEELRQTGKF